MKNAATIEQLELGVQKQIRNNWRNARQERQHRARWWFSKMRQVMDLAIPTKALAKPRPEQTYLSLNQTSFF